MGKKEGEKVWTQGGKGKKKKKRNIRSSLDFSGGCNSR